MSAIQALIDSIQASAKLPLRVTGPARIKGDVTVQSSKNSTMKLIAVAVALPGKYVFQRFPYILDTLEILSAIEYLGATVTLHDDHSVSIDSTTITNRDIPYAMTKKTTGVFGFAGGLLGRFGTVSMGKPGGDELGPRPVDLHTDGFKALGATVVEEDDHIAAEWPFVDTKTTFSMRMASTGAGVNFVCAVAARRTEAFLQNPPLDGDMQAMYQLLRLQGVRIDYHDGTLHIDATDTHIPDTVITFTCWPDRNDAFTWLAYGALSAEGLNIHNVKLDDLEAALPVLRNLGVDIQQIGDTQLYVSAGTKLLPGDTPDIVAGLGQQFHSDWAPLLEVVLTQRDGHVRIIQTLFPNRVRQSEILQDMGAKIGINGGQLPESVSVYFRDDLDTARYIIDVNGPSQLKGVTASVGNDVRACAATIMAASQAEGESVISDIHAVYRGYENYLERLQSIGVAIHTDNT